MTMVELKLNVLMLAGTEQFKKELFELIEKHNGTVNGKITEMDLETGDENTKFVINGETHDKLFSNVPDSQQSKL